MPKSRTQRNPVQGGRKSFGKGKSVTEGYFINPRPRSPVAKHAGINKAVTHPDQSKTIPRFRKHKLHEAMFDDQ